MEQKWLKNIRMVTPYTPGEQPKNPDVIKLNTNENPYPPAPGVLQAIRDVTEDGCRKYPDPTCSELVNAIAKQYGLDPAQVFTGVGSDDVLAMAFMTFFNGELPVLFPDITYSFYDVWSELLRIPYERLPLDDELKIRPGDYARPNGGIVFPNPNAPTGALMEISDVEKIIAANTDSIVIVDEAYIDFGGVSALPLLEKYPQLLVVQTFSKSRSLAGMRIGAAFGSKELIHYLNQVKFSFNSYTMDAVSLAAGKAAVEDVRYFEQTRNKIMQTRERTAHLLRELGFRFADSASNFLFVTHPGVPAKELFTALREKNIFVRYFRQPRIDNYLRITIGTDEEMDTLVAFLKEYLKDAPGGKR